mmetsp:Transcript_83068/g.262457  ORF Transcript_83068/g.262457 Transcript_83068/m.262457 type:complete len:291 (-) Transcript_83068:106-978(-)
MSQRRLPSARPPGQRLSHGRSAAAADVPAGFGGMLPARALTSMSSASTAPGGSVTRVPPAAAATSPQSAAPAPPRQAEGGSARARTSAASGPVNSKYATGSSLFSCNWGLPCPPDLAATMATARSRLPAASSTAEGCTHSHRHRKSAGGGGPPLAAAAPPPASAWGACAPSDSLSPLPTGLPAASAPAWPTSTENASASPGGDSGAGPGGGSALRARLAACLPGRHRSSTGAMGLAGSPDPSAGQVSRAARIRRVPSRAGPARLRACRTPQSANTSAMVASEPMNSKSSM